ncbi:YggT family protein [Candidatus Ichthyocystis hellenicum]|uniref:YggT family protein n=1 Tax=Candidatus Ichthyocystis hellenicum TaxID=1561003 RepID=UPI003B969DAE
MSFQSPIGLFVLSISNPLVLKIRKIMRPVGKFDTASLIAVWIVTLLQGVILDLLNLRSMENAYVSELLISSICKIALLLTDIYMFSTIAYAVLSWISPRNQTMPFFMAIVKIPIVTIRRIVKPIAQVDMSPFVFLLTLSIIRVPLKMLVPLWW